MLQRLNIHRLILALTLGLAGIAALWFCVAGGFAAPSASEPLRADALPATVTFNRYIRPILSDKCFACHGPDINKRISGMRLDKQNEAFGPMPKHPTQHAFVPGHPEQSWAYIRMTSKDPTEAMPPPTYHRTINDYERALINKWIQQGAKWQEHWAFVKPVRPTPPVVQNTTWPHNDIDNFILARLEQDGLQPNKPADKTTLIRRVSLDLTGIPPTPAEVDAFVADNSPNAYEKVVDRLLASPRYGEQMAVAWLDSARYADSHGFQGDPERYMSHWRDWVINAYNHNMPFDQFTIEQLAGDLLPNATDDQRIATGFNRNHRINDEGGAIPEEWRIEGVIDRVETTSQTWLGLTMGCCRCHDHKYDPITQKEFYQFSAFFNTINEVGASTNLDKGANATPLMRVYTPQERQRMAELTAIMAGADVKLKQFQARLPDLEKKYKETAGKSAEPAGLAARFSLDGNPLGRDGTGKVIPATVEGKSVFVPGPHGKAFKTDGKAARINAGDVARFERNEPVSFDAQVKVELGGGSIFSRMDGAPAFRGFDLAVEGKNLAVYMVHQSPDNSLKVLTTMPFPRKTWVHVTVTYDGSSQAKGLRVYFDGQIQPAKIVTDHLDGTIVANAPFLIGSRATDEFFNGEMKDVRFYKGQLSPGQVHWLSTPTTFDAIMQLPAGTRTSEQNLRLTELLLASDPEFIKADADIVKARQELDALTAFNPNAIGGPNTTMIMQEMPKPRDTFILRRGQYDQHGDKVEAGTPAILPPLPTGMPANRLTLAKWIMDPANPLTSRVQANRFWEKFFGIGIVKTSENMGTQSEWPSNPELLDYLATEFIRLKWNLKAFQKEIVMSAAYQEDSTITPEALERDPDNRLLARGPRFRLPSETIRDQALYASGLLVEKIGGPSVKPYESPNLWEGNKFGNLAKYNMDHGDSLYRRSLYTFWKRTAPPPNLMVFDMPDREVCTVKRSRTNTPLQALDLLNDVTYVEAARVLGQHMMTEGGKTPEERIAYGFQRITCRRPDVAETKILVDSFNEQLAKFRADHDAAVKFITVGESKPDDKLDPAELATYAMTASAILNLDETVTKQ